MGGGEQRCIQVLVRTEERKRPLVRPGRRWENNIKMDLHEVGYQVMNRIDLSEDRKRYATGVLIIP
jgi:hypothetical protein